MLPRDCPNARKRWRRWINRIAEDVGQLLLDDFTFRQCMDAAATKPRIQPTNSAYQLAIYTYGIHASIAIRRLVDSDSRTYSLWFLLQKIVKNPQIITVRSFSRRYPKNVRCAALDDFQLATGTKQKTLTAEFVEKDIAELERIRTVILPTVDKTIAHRERRLRVGKTPKWRDIHGAINVIERVCLRYLFWLHQAAPPSLLPTDLDDIVTDCRSIWLPKVCNSSPARL